MFQIKVVVVVAHWLSNNGVVQNYRVTEEISVAAEIWCIFECEYAFLLIEKLFDDL